MAKTNTQNEKNEHDKISTGKRKKTMRPKVKDLKCSLPDKEIQYVIENGNLTNKYRLFQDVALRKRTLKKEVYVGKPKKRKDKKKANDSILMSELLIRQPTKDVKTEPEGDNNNGGSQNKMEYEKTNEAQSNGEVTQITNERNESTVPEQTSHIETIKAKKKTQKSKINNKNNEVVEFLVEIAQTTRTTEFKRFESKDSEIVTQRLEQKKTVKLSNGLSPTLTHYQCDHCQTKFRSKFSLRRHMLMHLDIKPYSCSHCRNRKFRQRSNWWAHMARTHPKAFEKMKYECRICKKTFVLLELLKLHQKEHENEKRQHNTCAFCEKVFKEKYQLAKHEKLHMAPGNYKCAICSTNFDTRLLYSNHLKTHSQVQDLTCQVCGKSYPRPSAIARHIRVNHGGMRIQCLVCNKILKGHLHEHMRTHENQRPHKCDVCGQKFTQSTQLAVHKRYHSGLRPYSCQICKQSFSHSNTLMLHIRRHTGEKPFECALCPQTFSQLPHMKAHMRNIHNKTEFYRCNNCNTFFKLKILLEAHAEKCGEAGSIKKKDNGDTQLSRIRFLLALHLTMSASKNKLNDLGFNKRLIDDILEDCIEEMALTPCKDASLAALPRLQTNALTLLRGTVPKHQMARFVTEKKSVEEILELVTYGSDDLNKE